MQNFLPIKTKIAAWWMTVIGIVLIGFGLYAIISVETCTYICAPGEMPFGKMAETCFRCPLGYWGGAASYVEIIGFISFVFGLLNLFPGIFILKKKKIAWFLSSVVIFSEWCFTLQSWLLLLSITPVSDFFIGIAGAFFNIITFSMFILLLLDRKNFWKIAT